MKYAGYLLVTVIALLLLSFSPIGKPGKPTLPVKNGFGHIQWIQSISYHAIVDSTGSILKGDIISDTNNGSLAHHKDANEAPIQTWNYDEYGDEIDDAEYLANGMLSARETHIYYENGDVKEVIDSSFPYNATPTAQEQQYTYKYDAEGKLLISNKWEYAANNRSGASFIRTVNLYDSSGKLRKEMTFNADTINPATAKWSTYNAKGKLVETDERKREGNPPMLTPYEKNDYWYDAKGRLYDQATYHAGTGLVKDEKITFDSAGKTTITYSYTTNKVLTGRVEKRVFKTTNTTQEDTYDGDGLLTDYTIAHDSDKHIMDRGVFHITYHNGYLGADHKNHKSGAGDTVMVHHIINDDHFNTVIDDNFSNDGSVKSQKSYQYTYDSTGNWTERIEFNKDTPVKITERQIGYFKE